MFFTAQVEKHPTQWRSLVPHVAQHTQPKMICCLSPLPVHFAPNTFLTLSFVSIPEYGGGPTPLPAPKEMNTISMVISIMAVVLESLIREEKPGAPEGGSD